MCQRAGIFELLGDSHVGARPQHAGDEPGVKDGAQTEGGSDGQSGANVPPRVQSSQTRLAKATFTYASHDLGVNSQEEWQLETECPRTLILRRRRFDDASTASPAVHLKPAPASRAAWHGWVHSKSKRGQGAVSCASCTLERSGM